MHTVSYIERNGSLGTVRFPTLALAANYARTVKGGKVLPGGTDEQKSVNVVKLGTAEQEQAIRQRRAMEEMSERIAETEMEVGCQAILSGASPSEALDMARNAVANLNVGNLCSCGKRCGKGMTACYSCRRYF